jgi:hypothetical protein
VSLPVMMQRAGGPRAPAARGRSRAQQAQRGATRVPPGRRSVAPLPCLQWMPPS